MKGFSLIEMIIVLAIISIVGSVSVVSFNTMLRLGAIKQAASLYVDSLKEAQNKSKLMEDDTDWGVKIINSNIVVFSGSSYTARNSIRDITYNISNNLNISGPTEILFTKFTGLPTSYGMTTFSNDFGTSSVNVLAGGIIEY